MSIIGGSRESSLSKLRLRTPSVLYVATVVRTHIAEFHLPYLKMLKERGWKTAVAARNDYPNPCDCVIPYCDEYFDVPIERNPLKPANVQAYRILKAIINQHGYDVVHVHTPVGAILGRLAARKARKHRTKVIYTAHGFHFYSGAPLANWLLYFPAEWVCSWLTDVLITINHEDYDRARRLLHARKTVYVPGVGIDQKRFVQACGARDAKRAELGLSSGTFAVVSVGELIPRKNHRVAIEALGVLRDHNRLANVEYLICGTGPLAPELERLAKEVGVSDHVKLLGYRNDVPQILVACDVFVFPSLQEGLPVALLEAMATGLPVVCAGIRGNSDLVVDGENGIVVKRNDALSFANAIESLRQSDDLRARLGSEARKRAGKYSLQKTLHMVGDLYDEAVGGLHVAMLMPMGGSGGVQTVMSNLASGLDSLGCSVSMLCCDNSLGLRNVPRSVQIIDLGRTRVSGELKVAISVHTVRGYVSWYKPDVLITAPGFSGQVGVVACRGLSTKVMVMVDNKLSLLKTSSRKHRVFFETAIRTYGKADAIVFCHDAAREDFRHCAPYVPEGKLVRIYHPLIPNNVSSLCEESPVPALPPACACPHGIPMVVAAGRLVHEKGFDTLIRAFAKVRARVACKLVILGEGEQRESLESLALELGVDEDVLLPGVVDNVFAYYSHAAVFVLSSRMESFGNVLVEALASGATCVATACDSGGPQEILENGKWGLLVPTDDVPKLADAIERVLTGDYVRPARSIDRGLQFLVEASARAYKEAILQCLQ